MLFLFLKGTLTQPSAIARITIKSERRLQVHKIIPARISVRLKGTGLACYIGYIYTSLYNIFNNNIECINTLIINCMQNQIFIPLKWKWERWTTAGAQEVFMHAITAGGRGHVRPYCYLCLFFLLLFVLCNNHLAILYVHKSTLNWSTNWNGEWGTGVADHHAHCLIGLHPLLFVHQSERSSPHWAQLLWCKGGLKLLWCIFCRFDKEKQNFLCVLAVRLHNNGVSGA